MRNQEQILRLRKQRGHFLKRPNEASRRGFIGSLFALSCSNSVCFTTLLWGCCGFFFCLSKLLLRALRNEPRGPFKAPLDTEIRSPLFLCQVQPHQDEQETMRRARTRSINAAIPLLVSGFTFIVKLHYFHKLRFTLLPLCIRLIRHLVESLTANNKKKRLVCFFLKPLL